MTFYIENHPRLNLIDGVPAYKAGEWPGIKSNKFPRTKKIFQLNKSHNIFSTDDSSSHHGKRRINLQKPKDTIKTKTRRIYSALYKVKSKTLYYDLLPTYTKQHNRFIVNREYDFEKRANYYKMMEDNYNKKKKENEIMKKNKSNSIGIVIHDNNPTKGFNRQFFENVSKNKILGVTLTHDLYHNYKNKIEKKKKYNNVFRLAKKNKIKNMKHLDSRNKILDMIQKREKLKHDIEYVTSLDQKESKLCLSL